MLKSLLDILADRESGASEIERRLIATWLAAAPADPEDALEHITGVVFDRYPAMANLMGWVDRMWRLCEAGDVGRAERLQNWLESRLDEMDSAPLAIGRRLVPHLRERPIVFTLSRSGTVLAALAAARLAGARPRVRIAESRPESEGVLMAADLIAQGIETTVLPDFSLASLLGGFRPDGLGLAAAPSESLLLVGADGISVDTFVNKAGTAALAAVARSIEIPVLVAADGEKLLPPDLTPVSQIRAEPWDAGRGGVPGRRFDFERIANAEVDRFVLPDAELEPHRLAERIAEHRMSRHLWERLMARSEAERTDTER